MYAHDAFAAFDQNCDGMLSGSDFQAGLDWLGLKLDIMLLRQFMRELDKDKDGFINLEEFKLAPISHRTMESLSRHRHQKMLGLQHKLALPAPSPCRN